VTIAARLEQWRAGGAISAAQYDAISALVRRDRVSLFVELNALLYLGVVVLVAGLGWTVTTYSARLGDVAIVSFLTALFAWSLRYTFRRARPYSHDQVEQQGFAFDYVLYLGCLVFALDLGYLQARFDSFQLGWDHSLLIASIVFGLLAYRFDNRLVLSLALSSLGAWCGVRFSRFGLLLAGSLRTAALAYGGSVAAAGAALHRAGIKRHFLDTYLHVAANVLFVALLSGASEMTYYVGVGTPADDSLLYLTALVGLAAVAIFAGVRFSRFAFVAYGVVYGYLGISIRVVRLLMPSSFTAPLAYVVVSGAAVIFALVALARRSGREP
jgi:hypothetical protein